MLQRYFETNNSLSPARGSYSDQIKELTTVTKFVPRTGSYSRFERSLSF